LVSHSPRLSGGRTKGQHKGKKASQPKKRREQRTLGREKGTDDVRGLGIRPNSARKRQTQKKGKQKEDPVWGEKTAGGGGKQTFNRRGTKSNTEGKHCSQRGLGRIKDRNHKDHFAQKCKSTLPWRQGERNQGGKSGVLQIRPDTQVVGEGAGVVSYRRGGRGGNREQTGLNGCMKQKKETPGRSGLSGPLRVPQRVDRGPVGNLRKRRQATGEKTGVGSPKAKTAAKLVRQRPKGIKKGGTRNEKTSKAQSGPIRKVMEPAIVRK